VSSTFVHSTRIPIDGAKTLPREYYASAEIYQAELERIFAARWLCVGRSDEIAKPGDYVVRQVGDAGVIVLRDQSGRVRAFHNTCRHRGTRLCEAATGNVGERIVCPYHAWTYALDGRLIGAPSTSGIEGFDKSEYPLHRVHVAEWEGFVFMNLAAHPEPFEEAFAPLLAKFSRFNLSDLVTPRRIPYDVQANWKLLFQNYSECYHCSPVHPALVKLSPATSGENDLFEGPFLGGFMVINEDVGSMTMSGRSCGVPVSGTLDEDDRRRVYYYSIFPNMLLSLHPDYVMFHTLWPAGSGRTHITCGWMFHPDTLRNPVLDVDDGVKFWDMTNRQDWHICEESQHGIMSPAYRPGPYSPRESLSVAFDREVLKALHRGPETRDR
jgi:glycine betaine catabolism A